MEPQISLLANPLNGLVEWQCPSCGHLHSVARVPKTGELSCDFKGCEKRFRVGIFLTEHYGAHRCLFMGETDGKVVNSTVLGGTSAIGRIYSNLRYRCPACFHSQSCSVPYKEGTTTCEQCKSTFYVQLLLWKCGRQNRSHIPFDWSVPSEKHL